MSSELAGLDPARRELLERLRAARAAEPPLRPRLDQADLPLSFAQERFWLLEQIAPSPGAYTEHRSVLVRGPLDDNRLETAFRVLVERHDALRCVIRRRGSEWKQELLDGREPEVVRADLRRTRRSERWAEAERLATELVRRPFDLGDELPIRMQVVRLEPELRLVTVAVHHVASDGWSADLIARELLSAYEEAAAGPPNGRPPLQYADYAAWEREAAASGAFDLQERYWKAKVRAAPPPVGILRERSPESVTFASGELTVELSPDEVERLRAVALREGVSPFAVWVAATAVVLGRLNGVERVGLGIPFGMRHRRGLERIVGCMVNTGLLVVAVEPDATLADVLRSAAVELAAAVRNQDGRFEHALRESADGGPVANPFDVMVNQVEDRPLELEAGGLRSTTVEVAPAPARLPLTLYVDEGAARIRALYQSDLHRREGVAAALDQIRAVLRELHDRPDGRVSECSLVTAGARTVLPDPKRRLERREAGKTVCDRVLGHAAARPSVPALVAGDEVWTYRDLVLRAAAVALALRAQGVPRGARVVVTGPRALETIAGLLGGLLGGYAIVPLDPTTAPFTVREAFRAAQVAAAVSAAGGAELPEAVPVVELGTVSPASPDELREVEAAALRAPEDAYVFFTSGTTGVPRGVLGWHGALAHFLEWQARAFGVGAGARFAHLTRLSFDVVLRDVLLPLTVGGILELPPCDPVEGAAVAAWLEERGITGLHLTPSLAKSWLTQLGGRTCEAPLEHVFFAGEMLTTGVAAHWRSTFPRTRGIVNLYGPTETTLARAGFLVPDDLEDVVSPLPVGRALDDSDLLVVSRSGGLCGIGEDGEVVVRTAYPSRGYLDGDSDGRFRPLALLDDPEERVFFTGDLGRYLSDGGVQIRGRLDGQAKIRGSRVEPDGVAATLERSPDVAAAAVVAVETHGVAELHAYVVPRRKDAAALRGFMHAHLDPHAIPARIFYAESLPLTRNGKLDRRSLETIAVEPAGDEEARPPRTHSERVLAEVWREVFGDRSIGVTADFFALGGHSLRAAEIAARASERLGLEVPVRSVLETGTIEALAEWVDGRRTSEEAEVSVVLPPLHPRPEERFEPFELTDVQQAYLVGRDSSLVLGSVATHNYTEFEVRDLDVDRLRRALDRVIERHDMLRAVVGAEGTQHVLPPPLRLELPVHDVSREPEDVRAACVQEVRERLSHAVHELGTWPMFALEATRLSERDWVVHVSVDTLICDAWSRAIVARELETLYADPDAELDPVEVTFRDYVCFQQAFAEHPALRRAERYWRDRLRALPPAPALPRPAQRLETARFERRSATLPEEQWSAVVARAREHGLTPSAVISAAYAEVLARWSGSRELLLNLTLFNRLGLHPAIDRVVGDFTTLTLLHVDLSADTFRDRARALQARLAEDLDHRLWSGVRVVRELNALRGTVGAPIAPIVLTSTLVGLPARSSDGLWSRRRDAGISQTPQTLLDHQVSEDGGRLVIRWDALEGAFSPGVLDGMFTGFVGLLERLAADAGAWSAAGSGLVPVPAEASAVRRRVNGLRGAVPEDRLEDGFFAWAAREPGRAALAGSGWTWSYGDLAARAAGFGRALRKRLAAGDLVGVVLPAGGERVAAVLGVLRAGLGYVPAEPDWPAARLERVLSRSGVGAVVAAGDVATRLRRAGFVVLEPEEVGPCDPGELAPASGDGVAYVIFTSGSTGEPKGVAVTHRAAANTLADVAERIALGPEDAVLALSSLAFDLSVFDLFAVLGCGGRVVLPDPERAREPAHWLELVEGAGVSVWNSVPALLELYVGHLERHSLPLPESLRALLLSGDWIPLSLPGRVEELAAGGQALRFVSMGGATEAAIWSVWHEPGRVEADWASIPYGRPLRNQRAFVLDQALEELPDWVPGSLYLAGEGLALGYVGDPAQTAERFVPHPRTGERLYRTGDLARWLPGGTLELIGREDLQVKLHGHRVELGEIEATLERHPAVAAAAVTVSGERFGSKHLVGYVVPTSPDRAPDDASLRAWLEERLPSYMVPGVFSRLDALPLTPNGKVDRGALPELAAASEPAAGPGLLNELEEAVASIFARVLRTEVADAEASFLALGGDSMLAVRAVSELNALGPARLTLGGFFREPTVRGVARQLREAQQTPAPPPAEGDRARYPVTSAQERMLFLALRRRAGSEYNLPVAFECSGDLRVDALERAFRGVCRRHPALRASFPLAGSEPSMRIAPEPSPDAFVLRELGPADDRAGRLLAAHARARLDVERGPLARCLVLRSGDRAYVGIVVHHLVADAWSMQVLLRELAELYAAEVEGREPRLPAPPRGLGEHALRERAARDDEATKAQLEYWLGHLAGASVPAHPELGESGRLEFEVERALICAAPAFVPLFAAFTLVLAGLLGDEEPIVNSSVSTRTVESEDAIGLFLNTILLRVSPERSESLREHLERVSRVVLEGWANSVVPFGAVVAALSDRRLAGAQYAFGIRRGGDALPRLPGVEVRPLPAHRQAQKFAVELELQDAPDGFRASLDFGRAVLDDARAATFRDAFLRLLRLAAEAPETPVGEALDLVISTQEEAS